MDRRERINDLNEALLALLEGSQAGVWTAMPAVVQSFNATQQTISAQIVVKMQRRMPDGTSTWVEVSPLVDCPVYFPAGGGFTLTFPVQPGDECLIVFASRCIDLWWDRGSVQEQAELRMHSLSDGFALVGVRSRPRFLSAVHTDRVQLRSDDGGTYVEIAPDQTIKLRAPSSVTLDSPSVHITGSLQVDGGIVAQEAIESASQVRVGSVALTTHRHGGVRSGGDTTGVPTP